VYAPAATKKKDVGIGLSNLGYTGLIFVDPAVKVSSYGEGYYCDVLLSQ